MIGYFKLSVLLTYMNVAAAVTGVYFALNGRFSYAMVCLIIAGVCDMFDGTVARRVKDRTDREKGYGIELDAIADVVSFGVFPAVIGYGLGLNQIYHLPIHIVFVLAALTRLAYFNVTEIELQQQTEAPRKHYEGLPVTSVAIFLPAVYALSCVVPFNLKAVYGVLLVLTAIAFVSRFKVPKITKKGMLFLAVISIPTIVILLFLG